MNKQLLRLTALVMLVSLVVEIFFPIAAMAVTGGPSQPEFSKFEPVSTTSMVNEFDGSFTYNLPVIHIPGPDGGEYALSLSYHSGASPEEEASWVGYGWTLNAGSITRNKRGFPDDHNGAKVKYWNRTRKNWTITARANNQWEAFSLDEDISVGPSAGLAIRYNNYRGFGYTLSSDAGLNYGSLKGLGSLNLSVDDEAGAKFSGDISPGAFLIGLKLRVNENGNSAVQTSNDVVFSKNLMGTGDKMAGNISAGYPFRSGTDAIRPTSLTPYEGASLNFAFNPHLTSPLPIGGEVGFSGSYNYQANVEQPPLNTYGYMYSGQASEDGMMDYNVEKNSPYSRRDYYLSIPYSSADNFIVTGEGIAGGFRLFRNKPGHFKPNKVESHTTIFQAGADVHIGANIGLGGNIGIGRQTLKMGEWPDMDTPYRFGQESTAIPPDGEEMFFRYNNDPGGSITYSDNDNAEKAGIDPDGSGGYKPYIDGYHFYSSINNAQKKGRSSYIGYRTINEMRKSVSPASGGTVYYRSFSKGNNSDGPYVPSRQYFLGTATSGNPVYENTIGEVSTVNDQGYRYTYGLPVYSRKEYSMSYGVGLQTTPSRFVHKPFLPPDHPGATGDYDEPSSVVGEKREEPYATNYLLTEITTSDFVDRTHNGLTADDFGGYVQFHYRRAATPAGTPIDTVSNKKGGTVGWYRWRVPYTGFQYSQNEVSNPHDDMASMSSGEKELYYMQAAETKTHIAVFVTNKTDLTYTEEVNGEPVVIRRIKGSQNERLDAFEASAEENANNNSSATEADQYVNKAEYLERIELYAKDEKGRPGVLLKTVHFEYDYTLMKGQPNGAVIPSNEMYPQFYCGGFDVIEGVRAGKLTLRRVWSEYEGVASAKVAPYEFNYEYKKSTDFPSELGALGGVYADIVNYGNALTRDKGSDFYPLLQGTDQNPNYSPYCLDPWGSYRKGGEDRFTKRRPWVDQAQQGNTAGFDPAAWQLKSIKLPTGGEILVQYEQQTYNYVQDRPAMAMVSLHSRSGSRYYLEMDDLNMTPQQELQTVAMIRKEFIEKADREKMYFKFLYALPIGSTPSPNNLLSEYITGYATITNVGIDPNNGKLFVEFDESSSTPSDICREFVQKNRGGMSPNTGDPSDDGIFEDTYKVAYQFFTSLLPNITYCSEISNDNSFLRIPIAAPKKGGGVRVKRLLMYDSGIEAGDAALYGSEYLYETEDASGRKISSGVAANEPAEIREENALVRYLQKREDQNLYQTLTAGKDVEQFEGPIGEGLLPGAAIGYSRVVARNIHQGKTSPGFAINEYHTWKDTPLRMEHTPIEEEIDFYKIPTGVFNETIDNVWVTQGYSFITSNLPGKPKLTTTYAGQYNDPDTWQRSTAQEFTYFAPGETIPMHYGMDKPLQQENPGKEMEVVFESRSVEDMSIDGSVQGDVSVSITPPLLPVLFVTLMPQLNHSTDKMRTHVTNKIISYPAIVKSTRIFKDGVESYAENTAFDPNTGKPIITKSTDGFNGLDLKYSTDHDGTYYSWQVPAAQQYENMGQKAWNEQKLVKSAASVGLKFVKRKLSSVDDYYIEASTNPANNAYCVYDLRKRFSEGDLIELWNGGVSAGIFHIESIIGNHIDLEKTSYSSTHTSGIDNNVNIEVLASGHTNQLVAGAGSVVSYGRNTSSSNNTPTFIEFPTILSERQKLVDDLNKAIQGLAVGRSRDVALAPGMQYYSGSWLNFPAGSVLEVTRQANQYEFKVGVKKLYSYSAEHPGVTHPLVDYLNQVPNYWSTIIPNSAPAMSVVSNTLGFVEYRYRPADLAAIQSDMNNFLLTESDDNGRFNWVNGGYSAPFSISMVPDISTGYDGRYITGIRSAASSLIAIGSLQVSHGSTPVFSAYMQNKGGNQAKWLISPVNCGATVTSTPLPSLFFVNPDPIEFSQVGDKIYLSSPRCSSLPPVELPGITLNKLDWETTPICTQTVLLDGTFELNEKGQVVYHRQADDGACEVMPNCPQFWPTLEEKAKTFSNIVAASAQTYGSSWAYNPSIYKALPVGFTPNSYEKAELGKWRPVSSYTYYTDVPESSGGTKLPIYKRGIFSDFTLFNWKQPNLNNPAKWIRSSTALAYSPNGQMLAEVDALDMPSSAKFGYAGTVPYLVAKNADSKAVLFESFENLYIDNSAFYLEDGAAISSPGDVVSAFAHSGKKSYLLNTSSYVSGAVKVSRKMGLGAPGAAGVSVKVWVKHPASAASIPFGGILSVPLGSSMSLSFSKIARTGEWTLYEAQVPPSGLTTFIDKDANITLSRKAGITDDIYIDDVRVQPLDAATTCYVYDVATLRLITVLDDQHFGLYYQYNAEGKLIRKIVETERGLKTITETQYHTPLADYYLNYCPPAGGGGGDDDDEPSGSSLANPSHGNATDNVHLDKSILKGKDATQGAGGSVDLLDVKITPDSRKMEVLGNDKITIPDSLKSPVPNVEVPQIKTPSADSLQSGARNKIDKIKLPNSSNMQGVENAVRKTQDSIKTALPSHAQPTEKK